MLNFIFKHKYFFLLIFLLIISLLFYENNLDGLITFNTVLILIEAFLILIYLVFKIINFFTTLKSVFILFFSIIIILISVYSSSFISFSIFESERNNWFLNLIIDLFLVFNSFGEPEPSLSFIFITLCLFIILYSSIFIGIFKISEKRTK